MRKKEEEGGGDSVQDSAERCRKTPSIQSPAGNRQGRRRRIHPEPRRDFSACRSMDARGGRWGGEGGRRGGMQASQVFADVKS